MESDGPYFITQEHDAEIGANWSLINGPGIKDPKTTATQDYTEAMTMVKIRNDSYAEGRKAAEDYTEKMLVYAKEEVRKCHEEIRRLEDKYARNVYRMPGSLEKDFNELLEFANFARLCLTFPKTLEERARTENFDAWKKARGIE